MLPCGVPFATFLVEERAAWTLTWKVRCSRYDFRSRTMPVGKLNMGNLYRRPLVQTVLKAAVASNRIAPAYWLRLRLLVMYSVRRRIWWVVA